MKRSFWSTITGKLLLRTLVVVLIPVAVLGIVAVASLRSLSGTADHSVGNARTTLSEDLVGARVAGLSDQIAREIAIFLDERLVDAEGWARDPGIVAAAIQGAQSAEALGLENASLDDLEAMFTSEPRLGNSGLEADLLSAVANVPAFKEVFVTDANGYTIDYSNQTSDFVQSDEGWWQAAMENGIDISEPEFDASAGVFAVDISVRMDSDGKPVGVLKAALDIKVIQVISDRFAGGQESFDVSIVSPRGQFLAETSSDHAEERIMSTEVLASDPAVSDDLIAQVFALNSVELHPDGYSIESDAVGGFSHVDDQLAAVRGDNATDVSAFDWIVVVEQPTEIAFATLAPLEGLADQVSSTSSNLTMLLVLVALAGSLLAAAMALVFARQITSPIARLRDAAVHAAEVTLPAVVAQIDALQPDEELPELEPLTLATGDEVEDLAQSFNSVQQTAANLAAGQARMRRNNVATTFVNLGRRNQNLLSRQLEYISSMEHEETDSAALQRLFQLDHLATRMRRNAESLLVLAGEETPRRFREPVPMYQLLQVASGETEDLERIELAAIEEAAVTGNAASDVAHLLAELLENASTFSPPATSILIHGRRRDNDYVLAIVDQGIGMNAADLAAANNRLEDPAEFDRAPSAFLGHFVVGHLARRHGIEVKLTDSPYGGVTAQLRLPSTILTDDAAASAPVPALVPSGPQQIDAHEASPNNPHLCAVKLSTSDLEQLTAIDAEFSEDPVYRDLTQPTPAVDDAPTYPAVPTAIPTTAPFTAQIVTAVEDQQTTPSGFRRRRRGQEGAPPTTPKSLQPQPSRRSAAEAKASLDRFRLGVEVGRAEVTNPLGTSPVSATSTESEGQ